jgi:hypothetical protein
VDAAEASGLHFVHENAVSGQWYMPEIIGAGAALFDFDNDGDLDVYLVQGGPLEAGARPRAGNRLFRNDGVREGRPHFTDVTRGSGATIGTVGMGVAVADVDGDNWLDLFVTSFGANTLLHNNGDGTFTDVTETAAVNDPRWNTSAAFLDYDRDGDQDLFVATYVAFTVAGNKICTDSAGARDYCPPGAYPPVPARLYRNDGGLRFTDVTEASGVARAYGAGLGVVVDDFNGDGWPDIYVANDATPNQLWINRHDGTFEDQGLLSGTAFNAAGRPEGSMGIAAGDVENDGDDDMFITNILAESHVVYMNDGHGNFEDARVRTGLGEQTAEMTGFGTGWLDYDHDGLLDLFITNGAVNIVERLRGQPVPYRMRDQLFHNEGGARFREVSSAEAGPSFEKLDVGRGAAFGDVDNDGDVDILATYNGAPARLLLNQTNQPGAPGSNHWLLVALSSDKGDRRGSGARVGIVRGDQPVLWRRARSDGSYLSASDLRVHFGLGTNPRVDSVIVEWPDATRETFTGIQPDRIVTLRRGAGAAQPAGSAR